MKHLQEFWHWISLMGIPWGLPPQSVRRNILINRLNFIFFNTSLVLGIILFAIWSEYRPGHDRLIMLCLTGLINAVLIYHGFHKWVKLLFCVVPLFVIIIYPVFTVPVRDDFFFWSSYVAVAFSVVPHMIFSPRRERWFYWISVFYIFVIFISTESLYLRLATPDLQVLPAVHSNLLWIKSVQFGIYVFLNLSFYYMISLNRHYERRLEGANVQLEESAQMIKKQSDDLEVMNEELLASNEELYAANEEYDAINQSLNQEVEERRTIQEKLEQYQTRLEEMVSQRTNELEASERKFRHIFEHGKDAIIITDINNDFFLEVNKAFFNLTGYTREEIELYKIVELIPLEHVPVVRERVRLLKEGSDVMPTELELRHKDGQLLPVEINGNLIEYEGRKAVLTLVKDINERKKQEMALLDTIIQTEEKERKRIAGDLHDEVGPLLSSMSLYLSTLSMQIDHPPFRQVIDKVTGIIKDTSRVVRGISHNLSSHQLEARGLHATLEAEVQSRSDLFSIRLVSNLEDIRLESRVEIMVYRIILELLNNTMKHAKASEIYIEASYRESRFSLLYKDNGSGMVEDQGSGKGIGLLNIENRVKSIGGQYTINSQPGKGFIFEMKVKTSELL